MIARPAVMTSLKEESILACMVLWLTAGTMLWFGVEYGGHVTAEVQLWRSPRHQRQSESPSSVRYSI